jgi:hypothetical protein
MLYAVQFLPRFALPFVEKLPNPQLPARQPFAPGNIY